MISTIVTIDLSIKNEIKNEFLGSIFRGWLGCILKCNPKKNCNECQDTLACPYFMVFKEQNAIKPYSLLAFNSGTEVRCFIKLHGDKRKFIPLILNLIKEKENITHFGGTKYNIISIEAKNVEIPQARLQNNTRIICVSPLYLTRNRRQEIIPSFNTLIRSCVRSFNRIAKYYDQNNYPYEITDELKNWDAEILDFDVQTVDHIHKSMDNRRIKLSGIKGFIEYDTSNAPTEAGNILKMGEALQIGKHTSYGLGGFVITGS